jgi:hypothetical protein
VFVTIIVSDAKLNYVVHKQLITFYSPFFDRAFNGQFVEGETQTMTLEDVDGNIFGLFVNWLYTQKVCHPGSEPEKLEVMEMAMLWTLAGRFMIPKLQNQIMPDLEFALADGIWPEVLPVYKYAYEVEEATKLKLAAAQDLLVFIKNSGYNTVGNHVQYLPHNMLVDFTKILLMKSKVSPSNFVLEGLMVEEIKAEKDD